MGLMILYKWGPHRDSRRPPPRPSKLCFRIQNTSYLAWSALGKGGACSRSRPLCGPLSRRILSFSTTTRPFLLLNRLRLHPHVLFCSRGHPLPFTPSVASIQGTWHRTIANCRRLVKETSLVRPFVSSTRFWAWGCDGGVLEVEAVETVHMSTKEAGLADYRKEYMYIR
ncbi:hypothetical protein M427DRAFT_407715 [Gonapodya prolifera JEL478]|uniref:Uncharacterized protein n=1 Tax=Gonapodya prolifera (strain JEL478) TaxID=1344416 RepID=A0A139A5U9_GONPJ|nr:hypothetical protein M427DRAFT_407715 [Gonapodya prolifera JEL478]|eukprot:KXS12156.1 hypothetical protein M427DRAFT_407715 [Gonapodya prolifera JEL478]